MLSNNNELLQEYLNTKDLFGRKVLIDLHHRYNSAKNTAENSV